MISVEKARPLYPENDPVHGFDHVLRVTHMAEWLAQAEGADLEIVKAAALLHDGRRAASSEPLFQNRRGDHQVESAKLAAEILLADGWDEERIRAVQHCILAHRFRENSTVPLTIEAKVLFDADKLDAIGSIGAARAIAYAVQAGQPFYAHPSSRFVQEGVLESGEPHSAYHEFLYKLVKIKGSLLTSSAKRLAEERHRRMQDFFIGLAGENELANPGI